MYPTLFVLASRLSRSPEAAKDIVAEVFLKLWEGRSSLERVQDLKAYLYVSTRNRSINYLRSNSLRAAQELTERTMSVGEPSADDFFQSLLHVETVRALREAVNNLPPECKKVVDLVLRGYSTNDIAGLLGISASAVSHQKARAIKLLKDNVLLLIIFSTPAILSIP